MVDPPGFGIDWALLAQLAAGTSNPLSLLFGSAALARCRCPTRLAQLREQVVPVGGGLVDPSGRRGPHDGAIRQLFIAPATQSTMKSLEPVVFSAITRQIPWHRQPTKRWIRLVKRCGVVEVADRGFAITSRETTRHVAAADPALQRRRRLIAQGLVLADRGAFDRPDRRCVGELRDLFGIDDAVALQIARLLSPLTVASVAITLITVRTPPAADSDAFARAGQSGCPQSQARVRPSHSALSASARRWAMVRESLAHTAVAISERRLSNTAPAMASGCPAPGPCHRAAASR